MALMNTLTIAGRIGKQPEMRYLQDGTHGGDSIQHTEGNQMIILPAGPAGSTHTSAARDVLAERARQVNAEGWTPEHDDEHEIGELATAAACYVSDTAMYRDEGDPPPWWPWGKTCWKPSSRRRNLIKAGALILAEIERLDRAAIAKAKGEA